MEVITVNRSEIEGTTDLGVAEFATIECAKVGLKSPSDASTKSPKFGCGFLPKSDSNGVKEASLSDSSLVENIKKGDTEKGPQVSLISPLKSD